MSAPRDRRPASPERCGTLAVATERRPDGTRWLVLAGELDLNGAQSLRPLAREIVEEGAGDVEVDAGSLRFCDAGGLGALVELNNQLCEQGRRLLITGANARLARLLMITDLENLLR